VRSFVFIVACINSLFFFSQPLDFSSPENWLVLPEKSPKFFKGSTIDSTYIRSVDVFYIFPTLLVDYSDLRWNAEMTDVKWKEEALDKPLAKQLIAAYMPGIGLNNNEFHSIPFMTTPKQVGGFVTWNTMNDQPDNDMYPLWYKGKACINPITWDLTKTTQRSLHKGFYYTNEKCYTQVFETELIDGAVCVRNFRPPFHLAVKKYKNLHIGDVNLFWKDIELNCKERIKAYHDAF